MAAQISNNVRTNYDNLQVLLQPSGPVKTCRSYYNFQVLYDDLQDMLQPPGHAITLKCIQIKNDLELDESFLM